MGVCKILSAEQQVSALESAPVPTMNEELKRDIRISRQELATARTSAIARRKAPALRFVLPVPSKRTAQPQVAGLAPRNITMGLAATYLQAVPRERLHGKQPRHLA